MRKWLSGVTMLGTCLLGAAATAMAQPDSRQFEVGMQLAVAHSGQFDASDAGIGGRFAWHPSRLVGIESEVNIFPSDFTGSLPFSRGRTELLAGATVGPIVGRLRPFARLRAGLVQWGEAPQAYACILIYPPPLACALATGRTLFATDIGGGIEVSLSRRLIARVDLGDRLLRYPGPVRDRRQMARKQAFFDHDFRLAVGSGVRF